MKKRNWFITGISSGLGKALANHVIERGDFAYGTFRQQAQVDDFNQRNNGKGFAFKLDLSREENLAENVAALKKDGIVVDVLVNNAGYGMAGAIEETSMAEVRDIFEVNVFSSLKLTQEILPLMRARGKGHIIQISSHGGFRAFAGFGVYNATKFALEGFSEALHQEVEPLGIKVTIVQPGPFRTKFAGESFKWIGNEIDDYKHTSGAFRQKLRNVNGKQEGDPEKAAKIIYDLTAMDNPPLRLPLGKIAFETIKAKLESVQKELEYCRAMGEGAVY